MRLLTFFVIIIIFFIYSFLNLGNFLDVTKQPSKTDLIVSLGGNGIPRLNKAFELIEKKYSNTIVVTGYNGPLELRKMGIPDNRLKIINNYKNKQIKFVINHNLKNTAEEILFLNKYMKENNLTNVTFVTEKPHSRRIQILTKILGNDNYTYKIVSYEASYWNSNKYYKNNYAREYAFTELVKIIYNLIYYGIFYNLGLNIYFDEKIEKIKPIVLKKIRDSDF